LPVFGRWFSPAVLRAFTTDVLARSEFRPRGTVLLLPSTTAATISCGTRQHTCPRCR